MAKEPENKAVSTTNKASSESPSSGEAAPPQASAASGKAGANETNAAPPAKAGESGNGADKDATGKDAVALLKADHRQVEALFQQYATARNGNAKRRLVAQIAHEFLTHSLIEEKIFYPACREKIDDDDLDEAQVEHDSAKLMLRELREGSPGDPYYDAKVTVLGEYIKHHVAEEERSGDGIFASARKAGVDLAALGKEISDRREEMERQVDEERQPAMPSLNREKGYERKEYAMAQQDYRDRDRSRSRYDDEDDRGRRMPPRDSEGRFMSEGRGGGYRSSRDYDDDGDRGRSHGGWFGDPEGHSEASRRGWEHRESSRSGRYEEDDRGRSASSRYDDEDNRGRRMPARDSEGRFMSEGRGSGGYRSSREDESRGRSHGGWYGDSEGHSEASRRGWEHREGSYRSSGRDEDEHRGRYEDERSRYSRGREDEDDRGRSHGGWYGDPRGHSEAARRGWQNR